MAKNLIEFNAYDADVVPYSGYNSNKTVLGSDIHKFTGFTPAEYYIGPNETAFRDITQDTGISNWGDIDAITYRGNKQWLFCLKGFTTAVATTDIVMYEFDKSNYTYTYIGEIRCSGADVSNRIQQGIKTNLDYYSSGTVEVSGTSVTGLGTNWIEKRIPIGARIGFGSTNPEDITTWYRITNYPLMNSTPTKTNSTINCVTVDPSTGKIYIGGAFTSWDGVTRNRIARLNTDGTLDITFDPGTGFNGLVRVITIDSAGKLYVGGDFTTFRGLTNNYIIKLNNDGTKDTSFDNTTGFQPASANVTYDIKIDSLGKIWVGGSFVQWKGISTPYLTKLNPDGSRDTSYPNTQNPSSLVSTIALDNNEDIYIGGQFSSVGAVGSNFIAKILKTGGLDSSFIQGSGFGTVVNSIHYKQSTNTIIVGGGFLTWKGVSNTYLTELSSTGTALISNASSQIVYGLKADSLGNIYCNADGRVITKRNINTLVADSSFTPNIVYTTLGVVHSLGLNLTEDRLYVISGNLTVDSGIVCVETTGGTRDVNFITTPDWKSQSITINSSAGTLSPGTPYVIEDLKIFLQRAVTGTHMIQGISIDDFTITPNNIAAPIFNFMGLAKGRYNIQDAPYFISNGFQTTSLNTPNAKDLKILQKENDNTQYVYVVQNNGRISRFNIKSNYINQLGSGTQGILRYSTLNEVIVTGVPTISQIQGGGSVSGFISGKFSIGTMQSGSVAGIKSIYLDNNGIVQTPINSLENEIIPIYNYMPEIPPGSTNTYPAAGNVGRVYFVPEIDKLIVLNSSATAKSYITGFNLNLQQPTLSGTLYGRDTFNRLSLDNSYDLAFLVNGQQLQGSTSNINAPKYPDTLGIGFFGAIENGVLHLSRPINTIQNNLYAVPIACEAEYVDFSNNALITPKFNLPNLINISGIYLNSQKEYGTFPFNIQPEPIIIDYRTEGIDDNSGEWKRFINVNELNEEIICEGTLNNITIQFRFSYKVAGSTCLTNKIYGFSLIYEDDRTDSNYTPSVSKSNLTNRIFAWRQDKSWFGNIPNLKIRLYNTTNNNIVFYDTVLTSASGTWEYSTDGNTWLPWDSTADNIGNYIRYVADFIPSGIKLRVGLNRI